MHNPNHFHKREEVRADELIPGVVYFDTSDSRPNEACLEFVGLIKNRACFKYVSGQSAYIVSDDGLIRFSKNSTFYK